MDYIYNGFLNSPVGDRIATKPKDLAILHTNCIKLLKKSCHSEERFGQPQK